MKSVTVEFKRGWAQKPLLKAATLGGGQIDLKLLQVRLDAAVRGAFGS